MRRYPVSEEYKAVLQEQDNKDNSAQSRLNTILNDLLLKSMFSNEFRNLSDFLNYERIMVEKLFNNSINLSKTVYSSSFDSAKN